MHNLFQTFKQAVVHVIFYERGIRALVHVANGRRKKHSVHCKKVAATVAAGTNIRDWQTLLGIEKPTKTVINKVFALRVVTRIAGVGHFIKRVGHVFRNAKIGVAKHGEHILTIGRGG